MARKQKEIAYAHIRRKVLMGEVPMGGRLSEEALAGEIGVSRTPIREALNQLGAEGLLQLIPNHGARVQKLSRRDVKELYELRALLEGYAVEEAAQRITPEQIEQLQMFCRREHELCVQLHESDWTDFPDDLRQQWILADVAFHLMILHIAASPRAARIISDLRILTQLCGHTWIHPERYRRRWYYLTWADHLRVMRALARRDGPAARVRMVHHIREAMKGVLKHGQFENPDRSIFDLPDAVRQIIGQMEHFTSNHEKGT